MMNVPQGDNPIVQPLILAPESTYLYKALSMVPFSLIWAYNHLDSAVESQVQANRRLPGLESISLTILLACRELPTILWNLVTSSPIEDLLGSLILVRSFTEFAVMELSMLDNQQGLIAFVRGRLVEVLGEK